MVTYLPCQREMLRGGGWSSAWQGWTQRQLLYLTMNTMILMILMMMVVHRNLDPTRHTNSDALKAHIITFEVTNTSLIAHFFRSNALVTILYCCWKWDISLQTLLEEEEDQLKGFFFRTTFKTNLTCQVSRTSLTAAAFLSLISPSGVRPRFFEHWKFGNLIIHTFEPWNLKP